MANLIEKAAVYQKELDRQIVAEAVTGWMEANASQVQYHGGDEIKIPSITMDGLGDYDRSNGYPGGGVSLSYETMKMTMDRANSFNIDAMDVDESGLDGMAGLVMSEFQREHVIPEIDAYRLSRIYKYAADANQLHSDYTPAKSTVLDALKGDIATVQDQVGENVELVVHISIAAAALIDNNESLARHLNAMEFTSGEVKMKVKGIDGVPLLRTPSSRMKTGYTFNTGAEKFGFEAAADAKAINWLIMARRTPIAVSRTDTIRIFDPLTWQKANAWHMDYRKYHDLWIPKNRIPTLCANVGA